MFSNLCRQSSNSNSKGKQRATTTAPPFEGVTFTYLLEYSDRNSEGVKQLETILLLLYNYNKYIISRAYSLLLFLQSSVHIGAFFFSCWEQLSGLSGGVARALTHAPVGAIACRLAEQEATGSP